MAFELSSEYIDVAARIREFREQHPGGALQPADLAQPYRVETIGDQTYIVVVAAAYRTPDDPRPGVGMAYEQFPGRTPYTKNSELQNAETSAWGRAIVAALAADTRKGVASADEVRNRQAEREVVATPSSVRGAIARAGRAKGMEPQAIEDDFAGYAMGESIRDCIDVELLTAYLEHLQGGAA